MEGQILRPAQKPLDIRGKIFYRESIRAWNTIRFGKTLVNEFPALKERRAKFSYNLLFYKTYDELEKAIRKMRRNKDALPILMFLQKDKIKNYI